GTPPSGECRPRPGPEALECRSRPWPGCAWGDSALPRGARARSSPVQAWEDRVMAKVALHLTGDKDADALLSRDPLALLLGMVLDQQIPMERAFWGPSELARRMGGPLDAATIASMDPEKFASLFKETPALHRFPGSMAGRVQ